MEIWAVSLLTSEALPSRSNYKTIYPHTNFAAVIFWCHELHKKTLMNAWFRKHFSMLRKITRNSGKVSVRVYFRYSEFDRNDEVSPYSFLPVLYPRKVHPALTQKLFRREPAIAKFD